MSFVTKLSTGILAAVALTTLGINSAQAATDKQQYLAITPVSNEISVKPGQSYAGKMSVINQGETPFKTTMSVAPYHVNGADYTPQFNYIDGATDVSSWIELSTSVIPSLGAHKMENVFYTVTVPSTIKPGGYYAVIFAEASPAANSKQGVVAHNRLGELLYITIEGPVAKTGEALADTIAPVSFDGSIPIIMRAKNTGGVHFQATTRTAIYNLLGQQLKQDQQTRYILPQTERIIDFKWQAGTPVGLYRVERSMEVLGKTTHFPATWVLVIQPVAMIIMAIVLLLLVLGWNYKRLRSTRG